MALTLTSVNVFTSGAAHGTGGFTTSSFTPADNSLLVVCLTGTGVADTSVDAPLSLAGGGLTWTRRVIAETLTGGNDFSTIWTAPVTTGASMTLTADCGALDIYYYMLHAFYFTGQHASPIGGKASGTGSGTPKNITLDATPAASSYVLSAAFHDSAGTLTQGAEFNLEFSSAPSASSKSESRTGSTSTTVGWTSDNAETAMSALEIKAAQSGFVDLGNLGATGSTATNQASLALTLGATGVAVGELVVIAVADDNRTGNSGANQNEVASVADSGGNAWIKAHGWSYSAGSAQDGASVSVWYTVAKTAIAATTGTITATFTSNTLSDATGLSARHFSMGGRRVAVTAVDQATGAAATSPGSLDCNTADTTALRIRAFGAEVGNNVSLTQTLHWTPWANGNSATSGTTGEQVVRVEHIISTGTSGASNPGWAITCDYAHVYVALVELPSAQDFVEWENPQHRLAAGAHIALRSETEVNQRSRLLDLQPPAAAPFAQTNWANPNLDKPFPISLRGFTKQSPINLAVIASTDTTRSPIVLRGWSIDPNVAIRAQTEVTQDRRQYDVVAPPFVETDWPNPRGSQFPSSLRTWTVSFNQGNIVPFLPKDWPNPREPHQPVSQLTHLNQKTLDPPLRPLGWPNPRGYAFPIGLLSWTGRFDPTAAAVQSPFYQTNWPNPQRHGPRIAPLHFRPNPGEDVVVAPPIIPVIWPNPGRIPGALWAQIQPQRVAFIGFDTFFGEPGQAPPHVLPNPRGPTRPHVGFVASTNPNLSSVAVATPFAQTDWSTPARRKLSPDWIRGSSPDTLKPPFAPADWPNPLAPRYSINLRTHISSFQILTYVTPELPPIPYDWPNPPRGPAYPIVLRGFVQGQNRPLIDNFVAYQVRAPVVLFSWPQTIRPVDQPQNLLATTLGGPSAPPIRPIDWPVPRVRQPVIGQASRMAYLGFDTFFGAPGQVPTHVLPNPRGPLFSIGLRTHIDLLKILTYVPPPQVPTHVIPNPRGPLFPVSLRSHLVPLNLLAGKDTFFGLGGALNFNWPNPVPPAKFRQEGTLGENRPLYGGGVVPSAGADEWIIRARRRGRR